jgi:hypothetical protein
MLSTLPSEDIDWQTGLKSNTQQFVAYEKHISLTKTNIGLGLKGGKRFSEKWCPKTDRGSYTYL